MLGMRTASRQRHREEGEKPFWISYADLMTAMMVLFLVVMVASLSSVTQRIQRAEQGEKTRGQLDRTRPPQVLRRTASEPSRSSAILQLTTRQQTQDHQNDQQLDQSEAPHSGDLSLFD